MKSNYNILTQIPKYKLFRAFGYPKMLPFSITVSVTYHCNSRCKTCNVWRKDVDEFSFDEFDRTFKNIGEQPYMFVLSGGEPFLRRDVTDICHSIYTNCKPKILTICTNGILCDLIPKKVQEIVDRCPDTQIIINLSLDGIKEKHDDIRGIKNNYEKTINTYKALQLIVPKKIDIGIHTVISRFNINDIAEIYEHISTLEPDSYITEIAEERVEMDNIGTGITPDLVSYSKAIDFLVDKLRNQNFSGVSKITQSFRLQYYELVKKTLEEKRQIIPCYAGFASAQIVPNGDVWACCIKAEPIGNLRDNDYDIRKIWFGERANNMREFIKGDNCYCPLANVSYTNMLCDIKSLSNVALRLI